MRLSSWLSGWTRRAGYHGAGRNRRSLSRGKRRAETLQAAIVAEHVEPLEPRVVLDASTPVDDLAAFAKLLNTSGVKLYGAAWDATTTAQRQLFGDGSQFLPFTEVTNGDHAFNGVATANAISTTSPTWVFPDDSRLTGTQTLAALASQLGVSIPQGFTPGIAPIGDLTVLSGSPLMVPLDGFDPNNDNLTYTVTLSGNTAGLTATLRPQNGALKISVAGYGDMLIDTFDDLAPRVTDHIKQLAESGFYDGVIFHRVINNFVIQGGDPTGTGSGGSTLGEFDDQFNVDFQHNRTGLISMAKTDDDTNDSQFFITEGPTRHLDFQHSIFGIVVEGESVRDAISNTAVNNATQNKPVFNVTMQSVDVVEDNENAVLMLKAPEGVSGVADVTVRVTDPNGNFSEQTFHVVVQPDTTNSSPFLEDIPFIRTLSNTPVNVQMQAIDVDPNPVGTLIQFLSQAINSNQVNISVGQLNGLATINPVNNFAGGQSAAVGARLVTVDNTGAITNAGAFDVQVFPVEVVSSATTLSISANDDPTHDAADDGSADTYLVRLNNGLIEVTINGKVAILAHPNSVSDLVFEGSDDTDSLTIDNSNGSPIPAGGLTFNGQSQASGGKDQMIVKGASASAIGYTLTDAQSGSFTVNGATLVTFTGLEAVNDLLVATNRTVQFADAGGSAVLSVNSENTSQRKLAFGNDFSLTFAPPANSLTIVGGAGTDTLTVSFSNGSLISAGGVFFQAGLQTSGERDRLVVTGATVASVFHAVTNGSDGFVAADGATRIDYTGVESVEDDLTATNRGFQFGDAADMVVLSDDGVGGNGKSKLTYGTKEFIFTNSVNSTDLLGNLVVGALTINGGKGDDTLSAVGLDSSFPSDGNVFLQGELGNDTIDTSAAGRAFWMFGGDGNDLIVGNVSDETIPMDAGNDSIIGNGGTDRVVAQNLKGAVTLNDTLLSGLGLDSLSGIEKAQLVGGTNAVQINASSFTGTVTLTGGSGSDLLIGTSGADLMSGGAANDTLQGGAGDDTISGGAGVDSLDGGIGNDLLTESTSGNVVVTATQVRGGGALGTDKYFNVESMQFTGDASANQFDTKLFSGSVTLLGGDGADTLISGSGNDSLQGQGGNDVLTGGAGDDSLDGGDGVDRIIETANANWALTDLALSGLGSDLLSSIEEAWLTAGAGNNTLDASGYSGVATLDGGAGNDTLLAGTGGSSLLGNAGNDSLVGNSGNDTLLGGNDTDTLSGDAGNDSLDGGAGNNDIVSGGAGNDKLNGGGGNADKLIESGDASLILLTKSTLNGLGSDTIAGFEVAILTGGTSDNTIDASGFTGTASLLGGDGNDVLVAGTGAATLDGGSGNDTLTGGKASDSLLGGNDSDLILESGNGSITATATQLQGAKVFGTDTYSGIERIQLTGGSSANRFDLSLFSGVVALSGAAGNDTLTGTANNDALLGGDGNDVLKGGLGNDALSGDAGNDTLNGGDGDDSLDGGTGNDALSGYLGSDQLVGGAGLDSLVGGNGNDTLLGGADKDSLVGGLGDDSVDGQDGDDSVTGGVGDNAPFQAGDTVAGSATEINDALKIIAAWIDAV